MRGHECINTYKLILVGDEGTRGRLKAADLHLFDKDKPPLMENACLASEFSKEISYVSCVSRSYRPLIEKIGPLHTNMVMHRIEPQ